MIRLSIASDHQGFVLKQQLLEFLKNQGHDVLDCGTDSAESVDYPDFANPACQNITSLKSDRAILICGSGIGMSIAANRHRKIRAALCRDENDAIMARSHNDSNVLVLGSNKVNYNQSKEIVIKFLNTEFEGGRHSKRLDKIF